MLLVIGLVPVPLRRAPVAVAVGLALLRILLRDEVLDDLLQRLGALDRVHGLPCRNLLGGLDGHLDRVRYLLLQKILRRPWILLGECRVGNGTGAKAAIS